MYLKSILISSLFLTCLGYYSVFGQNEQVLDQIVAKVDDYIILQSELDRAYIDMLSRGSFTSSTLKCDILEKMVIDKLLVAKAEIDSVIVSEEEVEGNLDRRFNVILSQIGSQDEIEKLYGKSVAELKEDLRDQVREQLIIQRMQSTITDEVDVTPAEVRKFFKQIPADSLPYFSKEVSIAQIVKFPEVSKRQKELVRRELLDIKSQIATVADFESMARRFSQDPGSAYRGGNYDYQKRGSFVPEYEAAVFKMEPGEISEPVESDFGYHIIQLVDRRGNEYKSRHILLKIDPSEEDLKNTEKELDSLTREIEKGTISFEKAASELSDDLNTSGSGGFFTSGSGELKIPVDDIDPVLFFTIDTMSVGSISPPLRYRTNDGKDAVRIIYYKSFTKPHQANFEEDYQKIYSATLNDKRNSILSEWFEEARYDVYIDIDETYNNCKILQ
jgi:peptidyl-prolyl cis-trans isomerase SurA